jgi:hypothetical protein
LTWEFVIAWAAGALIVLTALGALAYVLTRLVDRVTASLGLVVERILAPAPTPERPELAAKTTEDLLVLSPEPTLVPPWEAWSDGAEARPGAGP